MRNKRMRTEQFCDRGSQCARPTPMNNSNLWQLSQKCFIQKLVGSAHSVVHLASYNINFAALNFPRGHRQMDAGGQSETWFFQYLQIRERPAHAHVSDNDLGVFTNDAGDRTSHAEGPNAHFRPELRAF